MQAGFPTSHHSNEFALARLSPKGAGADLAAIRQDYRAWSTTQPVQLSDAEIGEGGIAVAEDGGRLIAVGVSLKRTTQQTLVAAY